MCSNVVPFPVPNGPPPTREELVAVVKWLALDSNNIYWEHPHVKLRMDQRSIHMRQVLETLRQGIGIHGPTLDKYGDWRIKMLRLVAGRRIQVVVAVKKSHFVVVTVI